MLKLTPKSQQELNKIIDFLEDPNSDAPPSELVETIARVNFADNQLNLRRSDKVVIELMKKQFNVSERMAYYYVDAAKYIFSSTSIHEKNYLTKQQLHFSRQLLDLAMADNDLRSAIEIIKVRREIIKDLKTVEENESLYNNYQQNNYYMIIGSAKGKPKKVDLNNVQLLDDDSKDEILETIDEKMLPKNIVEELKRLHGNK